MYELLGLGLLTVITLGVLPMVLNHIQVTLIRNHLRKWIMFLLVFYSCYFLWRGINNKELVQTVMRLQGEYSFFYVYVIIGVLGLLTAFWWLSGIISNPRITSLQADFKPEYQYSAAIGEIKTDRIKVHNFSRTMEARKLEVAITDIFPRPKDSVFKAHYPYKLAAKNLTVNPCDDEYIDVVKSWQSSEGQLMISIEPSKSYASFQMFTDESWIMKLRISSSNAGIKELELILYHKGIRLAVVEKPR